MIVIADTSPLNYLVLIDKVDLLRQLYGRVIIPEAVYFESTHPLAPLPLRMWMSTQPEWLDIQQSPEALAFEVELDRGETEALTLASRLHADLILLDDAPARREAARLGIRFTGVLGVLGDAAVGGSVDLDDALLALSTTTFFASADLIQRLRLRVQATLSNHFPAQ